MIAPIVLVSALANAAHNTKLPNSKLPSSKLLALRGGGIDAIDAVSAINIVAGASSWLAPKKSLEAYGALDVSGVDSFFVRGIGGLQIALGAALIAGKAGDFNQAALVFTYGHLFQVMAVIPIVEALSVPTGGLVASGAIIATLGELTRLGVLTPSHLTNAFAFFYCLISLSEMFMPKAVLASFGFPNPTALTELLMRSYSALKLQAGAFVLVSKLTGKQGLGLVAALVVGAINCMKAIVGASETGLKQAGPLAWVFVQGALGLLAYKSSA